MFRAKLNWTMTVALLAVPAMAQQYPPPQPQQQPSFPRQEGQMNPPPQQQQEQGYPGQQQQQQYPAQQYPGQPQGQYPAYNAPMANYSPQELDQLVARIALYPDPLLAQVFVASTFPDQILDAAQWADQHHYLRPEDLARAIQRDQYGFDPAVQALLPFPSVLQMMAADLNWTNSIGAAFVSQGVMLQDAVQRMRSQAYNNGYLRNNDQIRVSSYGAWTEIAPVNPGYIVVPYYDPAVVYYRPYRPGARFGISFGYGVTLGGFYNPWGWGGNHFEWDRHEVWANNRVWDRRVVEERHVTAYRPYSGRPDGRFEQREPVYRPEINRVPQGRVERPDVARPEIYRPAGGGRPDVGRPEAGRQAEALPARPADEHVLQGRNDRERRAADTGRPAPRESHGREERRRN